MITKRIAFVLIFTLVISLVASVKASNHSKGTATATIESNLPSDTFLREHDALDALIPARHVFRPAFQISTTVPNFSHPIRRAPLRRKGRIQH